MRRFPLAAGGGDGNVFDFAANFHRLALNPMPATFALLSPDDPPAVLIENAEGLGPGVVVCDHGGRAVPARLRGLGLEPAHFDRHIAWDIGALALARHLARRFDMPLVSATYSRLVIDVNRGLDDPTLIPEISDEVVIPANRNLAAEDAAARAQALFEPYHAAVAAALESRRGLGAAAPVLLSAHSFTPVMRGFQRPWEIGILWDGDPRVAVPLLEGLRSRGDVIVGDNQPYSGRGTLGGTVETHALPHGLPNVLLEVRQDLIESADGAARWADALGAALDPILADPGLYQTEIYPRLPAA